MKRLLIPLAALSLASCATIATERRCDDALRAATTAEQIVAVLVNNGFAPEKAARLAEALMLAKVTIAVVCAA